METKKCWKIRRYQRSGELSDSFILITHGFSAAIEQKLVDFGIACIWANGKQRLKYAVLGRAEGDGPAWIAEVTRDRVFVDIFCVGDVWVQGH